MSDKPQVDQAALKTMEALLRQPPKQHSEMKLGPKRGRKPKGAQAMTPTERTRKSRAERKGSKHKTVAEEIAASKKAPTK